MPTPVGHFLAGAIIWTALRQRANIVLFVAILFFALLPDVDFIFGFVVGDPNRYHHQFTHSLLFVIVMGVIGGLIYAKWRQQNVLVSSAIFAIAGTSHVILDILAVDKREPFGCPLWWPFLKDFVISPVLLFSDVSRVSDSAMFFASLFNVHNLKTVLIELVVLMPLLFLVIWRNRK